jgi:hypothetical protein
VLVPITLTIYFYFPTSRVPGAPEHEHLHDVAVVAENKETFVRAALENHIDGPYRVEPLQELCKSINYQPGLIVKCDPPRGGFGNVKFMMLNCIRFAFEAGGLLLSVYTSVFYFVNIHASQQADLLFLSKKSL